MQNKSSKPENLFTHLKDNLKSFKPIVKNGWVVKFSTHQEHNILILFTSVQTGQTIIRYFTDEDSAVNFINFITEKDSSETWDKI